MSHVQAIIDYISIGESEVKLVNEDLIITFTTDFKVLYVNVSDISFVGERNSQTFSVLPKESLNDLSIKIMETKLSLDDVDSFANESIDYAVVNQISSSIGDLIETGPRLEMDSNYELLVKAVRLHRPIKLIDGPYDVTISCKFDLISVDITGEDGYEQTLTYSRGTSYNKFVIDVNNFFISLGVYGQEPYSNLDELLQQVIKNAEDINNFQSANIISE